jgi:hypothetical protein
MFNCAPIIIPTLNRYNHFRNCVESLEKNKFASDSDLIVALDFPLRENHWEGYNQILKYLTEIIGFKSVKVIKRAENFGAERNLFSALSEVFETYDRLILSEDDNVFSHDFLEFMNLSLDKYSSSKEVFSISGYNYPIKLEGILQNDVYFWTGFSAWGVGLWREKWQQITFSKEIVHQEVKKFLGSVDKAIKFNGIANHYIQNLMKMIKINALHADGYLCMYQFNNQMVSLFPKISRVRNMGHDGSGINCQIDEVSKYQNQEIFSGTKSIKLPSQIIIDKNIYKILSNHFKNNLKVNIKVFLKILLKKY